MRLEKYHFHNVAEMHPIQTANDEKAIRPQRVPESIRLKLNENAKIVAYWTNGAEIRFVPLDNEPVNITLSASLNAKEHKLPSDPAYVEIFWGGHKQHEFYTLTDAPQTIQIKRPERLDVLPNLEAPGYQFSRQVCRVCLNSGPINFHGFEGNTRPPLESELPSKKYLAYGTSISMGASATRYHSCYANLLATKLGVDLSNLAFGGSCHCEPEIADYLTSELNWDIATFELSVNMLEEYSPEEFLNRADYLLRQAVKNKPNAKIFVISIFSCLYDFVMDKAKTLRAYRSGLDKLVAEINHPNLHFISGPEMLPDLSGLTTDLIHPSDLGMNQIAENLHHQITEITARAGAAPPAWSV
ncbi:SGNH/GDSL hydrolase family protein [Cerasicoccus frondis]|uniref:SGNH/GDSL hydrolase family protein n=1 Tax=Cerasicoccus frondis TaxID=490090 RepID=UPI0028528D1D|nr:SGNH/GDSL hydrolase family protein [Cerasicoccus frondis]